MKLLVIYWTPSRFGCDAGVVNCGIPQNLLARLMRLDTCSVSDALDLLGLPGATTGIRPLWEGSPITGIAWTVEVGDKVDDRPGPHLNTQAIDTAPAGAVLVIANRGRTDVSCWGSIVTNAAVARGIAGVVIDGACRDIDSSAQLGLPLFGRAVVPVSARGRIREVSSGEPVMFAGVRVASGDVVMGDSNGVVFIPADVVKDAIELAEHIVDREHAMITAVRNGQSVVDVMHDTQFPAIGASATVSGTER